MGQGSNNGVGGLMSEGFEGGVLWPHYVRARVLHLHLPTGPARLTFMWCI